MINTKLTSHLFDTRHGRERQRRKGALLLELMVSAGMLMAILLAVSKMSVAQNRHQRTVGQEIIATHQLQNLMEIYLANDWNKINNEVQHGLILAESAQKYFPSYEISVVVNEEDEELLEKQVVIYLSWNSNQSESRRMKSLACWIYDQSGVEQ